MNKTRAKIGFVFPGQGSQYINMMRGLSETYAVVRETFHEADDLFRTLRGESLTELIFSKPDETSDNLSARESRLKETQITQPAVFTADIAMLRLLNKSGVKPDIVCGHSLGEYSAMVAAGVLSFQDAFLAVCARSQAMADLKIADPGKMGSVAAPCEQVEQVLKEIPGYVIIANKNCPIQTVIAGETKAVERALENFTAMGLEAQEIRVSHAFHSRIVEPAQQPYKKTLEKLPFVAPVIPILSNVTGNYYPESTQDVIELLIKQIASPVEFSQQILRMYTDGVRLFIEVGPKKVLTTFVSSILEDKQDALILFSDHPKRSGIFCFNSLVERLMAEGIIKTYVPD